MFALQNPLMNSLAANNASSAFNPISPFAGGRNFGGNGLSPYGGGFGGMSPFGNFGGFCGNNMSPFGSPFGGGFCDDFGAMSPFGDFGFGDVGGFGGFDDGFFGSGDFGGYNLGNDNNQIASPYITSPPSYGGDCGTGTCGHNHTSYNAPTNYTIGNPSTSNLGSGPAAFSKAIASPRGNYAEAGVKGDAFRNNRISLSGVNGTEWGIGGAGNDKFRLGGVGNRQYINGGGGSDRVLTTGVGNNRTLDLAQGGDKRVISAGNNNIERLITGAGNDTYKITGNNNRINSELGGGINNAVISGNGNIGQITGNSGNNQVVIDGNGNVLRLKDVNGLNFGENAKDNSIYFQNNKGIAVPAGFTKTNDPNVYQDAKGNRIRLS